MTRTPTRKVRLSRRDLLKVLQVGGLGAAATGAGLLGWQKNAAAQVTGSCRLCTMHCGVIATVQDGHLVRIEGDPTARTKGFICLHGQSMREVVHSPHRLTRPLKRQGDTFVELDWPTALQEIAQRLEAIKLAHGARAVALQTGWPFVRHPLIPFMTRFCQAFGTPNMATVASLCEATGRMGRSLTMGANHWPDVQKARTLFVWGANPYVTAPPFTHLMAAAARRDRHLVVIDPVKTEVARAASLHLQPIPGTDGILALGMIHVVLSNRWHNATFAEQHCGGLEELAASASAWPLQRVEQVTGVPADDVEKAARWFAQDTPSAIWEGLGVEHHKDGIQMVRAISALQAICGQVDVEGTAIPHAHAGPDFWTQQLPMQWRMTTPQPVPPPLDVKPIGYDTYPLFEAFNRQAQANLFANAVLEDDPYPLRGLLLWASNTLLTGPDTARNRKAFDKLDLLVVVDPFLTASAELADYVLPASTFAESPVVHGDADRVEKNALVPPQGGAWPDWRILFELARAAGLGRYFPWETFQEAWDAPRAPYMQDAKHQLMPQPMPPGTPVPRFPTPTGKIELRSTILEAYGYPGVPVFEEPAPSDATYPLMLVTGPRTRVYINSQFHQVPSVAAKLSHPPVGLHPDTAQAYGIQDGANVTVVTAAGRITMVAAVSAAVLKNVVVVPNGWAQASANLLTQSKHLDPVSGFPPFRSLRCRVEPG